MFNKHLTEDHGLSGSSLMDMTEESTIGFSGQPRFWCGFCKQNKWRGHTSTAKFDLPKWDGLKPHDDRFNHINEHFLNGEQVEDWVHWEGLRTKGELRDRQAQKQKASGSGAEARSGPIPDVVVTDEHSRSRKKRKVSEGGSPEREASWECCKCGGGPLITKVHADCSSYSPDCKHEICPQCIRHTGRFKVPKIHNSQDDDVDITNGRGYEV